MDIQKLIKNKYFLIGLVGIVGFGIYKAMSKNDVEIEEVEGIVEEDSILSDTPTSQSVYDLNYVIGYVDDYLKEITPDIPVTPIEGNDFSKDHVDGSMLSIAELKQYGLDGITGYNFFWDWTGSNWRIEKVAVSSTTGTTGTTTTGTTTKKTTTKQYVTVVKYTSKNPPWNSTLSGIANKYNMSLNKLLSFPENAKYKNNPNLIHVGDKVRVK